MAEPVPPRGLVLQTALLLAVGAGLGFGARTVSDPDFSALTVEVEQADTAEIAKLREQPQQEEAAPASAVPAPPRMVSFIDFRTQLYGQPGVTVLDARDRGTYEIGHIPGALLLDAEDVERDANAGAAVLATVPRTDVVVVYCSGGDCDLSMRLARKVAARGYAKVLVYEGGFNEWMTEEGTKATGSEPGVAEGG